MANKKSGNKSGGPRSGGSNKKRRNPPPIPTTRSRPWGLISAATVVVVFAAVVIGVAVKKNIDARPQDPAKLAADAKKIPGITIKNFPQGQHDSNPIKYTDIPPFGGTHDPNWADCSGTVYSKPVRDENAVHALEHGSVWVTYRPDLPKDQVDALKKLVSGHNFTLMSPYPGLKDAVSLQSWGYQLFVKDGTDPRVKRFIEDLRVNPQTTPEYGASCVNPDFKADPASPDQPAPEATPTAPASGTATPVPPTSPTAAATTPGT